MKKVFENRMVAHVWAQQNQSEGRSKNGQFYFRGKTIFSYRDSWPLATFLKNGDVLLNSQRYSVTTSKHLSYVRNALKGDVKIWHVDRDLICNPDAFLKLSPKKREKFLADKRAKEEADNKAYKNRMAKEARARRKEKLAADKQSLEELLTKWRNKEELNRYEQDAIKSKWREDHPGEPQTDFIRLKDDKTIETNRGAECPAKFAKKIYAQFKTCIATKTEWHKNGHKLPAGHFEIDSIDENGNIKAGCHYFAAAEVQYIANVLKL